MEVIENNRVNSKKNSDIYMVNLGQGTREEPGEEEDTNEKGEDQ